MTTTTAVRKDRKFYFSLELHREIDRIMQRDPELVRERGLEGVEKIRPNVSGRGIDLLDEWQGLLTARDWENLHRRLTSDDEHSVEMRNITVFLGIMPQERRQEIVDEIGARRLPV